MKSVFELWAESCVQTGISLYCMESSKIPETGLYQTKSSYTQFHRTYYNSPVYHVWIEGKRVVATTNYQEAVKSFEAEVRKITEASGEG